MSSCDPSEAGKGLSRMGRIRVQVIIALLAIVAFAVVMGYVAFGISTVVVPDHGGTYVEGIAGNPRAINPILSQSNPVDQDFVALIFTGLTQINDSGEVVPDLAERWETSTDGTVYTFYLRQGITWHDGAPFTADDVVFTINAIKDPAFRGEPFLSDMWNSVVVDQVGTYEVRFSLREPFAPFIGYTTVGILPVHILGMTPIEALGDGKFNAAPVGTGPFQVEEASAQQLILVANPRYYGPRPFVERLEFVFFQDEQSVYEARQRSEILGIARVLPQHLQAIRDDETLTLYSAPLSGYSLIYLNLDRGIFQDRTVRQAMMWALNRQKLVDEILGGQGIVVHSPLLPLSWAYDSEVDQYAYSPRRARTILEDGGWRDQDGDGIRERGALKLEFSLITNEDDPTRVRIIQAVSEQLAAVGVRAVPEMVGWEELTGAKLRLRRFDAVLTGWQNLPTDPDLYPYWHSSQANENGLNFANYISEEADAILEEARSVHDQDRRLALYQQFQELFVRDVPSLLLYQPVYNYAVDVSVHDVQIGPLVDSSDRFRTIASWYIATQRMLYSEAREKDLIKGAR